MTATRLTALRQASNRLVDEFGAALARGREGVDADFSALHAAMARVAAHHAALQAAAPQLVAAPAFLVYDAARRQQLAAWAFYTDHLDTIYHCEAYDPDTQRTVVAVLAALNALRITDLDEQTLLTDLFPKIE